MEQDEQETPVIFRRYRDGDIIALFPAEPGTYEPWTCSSYLRLGQHGSANPGLVIRGTKQAKPDEYASLKRELESAPYGYRLKVYSRLQPSFLNARHKVLAAMR